MNDGSTQRPHRDQALVSVVLPLFNESAVLVRLHHEVSQTLARAGLAYELVFVNDGSTDDSGVVLEQLAAQDSRTRVLHFSRNFGHQAAVQAGLAHSCGDAVIVMDSDLQDNPNCLEAFIRHWEAGYDVVYAIRTDRQEGLLKRFLFFAFYRVLNAVAQTPIPNDAGNFGLVDRRVAQSILRLNECDRYYPGLRSWVGFRQVGVAVPRSARHDRNPRVSMLGLFRLAKTALFSFSLAPLAIFYGIAVASLVVCGLMSGFTLYHKLITGLAIPGWTSTVGMASFFGALNALGIGVLGEYVVRIYDQVRGRPQFIVAGRTNFPAEDSPAEQLGADLRELVADANLAIHEAQTGARLVTNDKCLND